MLSRRRSCLGYLCFLLYSISFERGQAEVHNVTVEDSDVATVFYSPSLSWRSSIVPCGICLNPSNSSASGGTWHDGTHIIPDVDADDTTTSSPSHSSTSPLPPPPKTSPAAPPASSSANPPPAATSEAPDGDEGPGGDTDGKNGDGKQKGKGEGKSRRSLLNHVQRQDITNPFQTTGNDSDDPGFKDTPVTATINFTGSAIYLFAIVPLFPAQPMGIPTIMNLSFTLDGSPHGVFRTDPTTLNGNAGPQYQANFSVFGVSGLQDGSHSIVVNVGPDSVFLFDYALVTQDTDSAPNSAPETTVSSNSKAARNRDIATFIGAIGGSVGLLSILSLGLCISIKLRRRRFIMREQRHLAGGYAEAFTSNDHGGDGEGGEEGESIEGGGVSGAPPSRSRRARRMRLGSNQPLMSQVAEAPFVPRYFPGSVPASPPPYVAESQIRVILPDQNFTTTVPVTESGSITPFPPPPQFTTVSTPPPLLSMYRTNSGSTGGSYADRPPPTPPPELEQPIAMFNERGMVTPPHGTQGHETNGSSRRRDDDETASLRRSIRSMMTSSGSAPSSVIGSTTTHTSTDLTATSATSSDSPPHPLRRLLPGFFSSSASSLIPPLTPSSSEPPLPQYSAPQATFKTPNLLGGPVSIPLNRSDLDSSSLHSPSRVQSLPHLRTYPASSASGNAEDRMSLRSFSIDDHDGVGPS